MKSLLVFLSQLLAQIIARVNILMLDFCMGAMISTHMHYFVDRPVNIWLICAGGLIAIVPDLIDLILQPTSAWIYGRRIDPHRMINHWPLVMIPFVGISIWYRTHESFWLTITCITLGARYVHHMIGHTSGIRLFAPMSMKFFGTNGIEDPQSSKRERYRRSHSRKQSINDWMRASLPCVIELGLAFICAAIASGRTLDAMPIFLLSIVSWIGLCFCVHIARQQDRLAYVN